MRLVRLVQRQSSELVQPFSAANTWLHRVASCRPLLLTEEIRIIPPAMQVLRLRATAVCYVQSVLADNREYPLLTTFGLDSFYYGYEVSHQHICACISMCDLWDDNLQALQLLAGSTQHLSTCCPARPCTSTSSPMQYKPESCYACAAKAEQGANHELDCVTTGLQMPVGLPYHHGQQPHRLPEAQSAQLDSHRHRHCLLCAPLHQHGSRRVFSGLAPPPAAPCRAAQIPGPTW